MHYFLVNSLQLLLKCIYDIFALALFYVLRVKNMVFRSERDNYSGTEIKFYFTNFFYKTMLNNFFP